MASFALTDLVPKEAPGLAPVYDDVDLGTPAADRLIVCMVCGVSPSSGDFPAIESLLVGAVEATFIVADAGLDAFGNRQYISAWVAAVPAADTDDVFVDINVEPFDANLIVYAVYGVSDVLDGAADQFNMSLGETLGVQVDADNGGPILGGTYYYNAILSTWLDLVQQGVVYTFSGSNATQAGAALATSTESNRDVDVSYAAGLFDGAALCAVSFSPAAAEGGGPRASRHLSRYRTPMVSRPYAPYLSDELFDAPTIETEKAELPPMRAWFVDGLQRLIRWIDPPPPLPPPDVLKDAARELVAEQASKKRLGELKRRVVLSTLRHRFPDARTRDLAYAIESVLQERP